MAFRFTRTLFAAALLAVAVPASLAQKPAQPFYLHDGDTVVFYGDSITDQRLYTTYVEYYVATRFPKLHLKFVHSGWGGDAVGGGGGGPISVRLQRDLIAYKPTVMTSMLGMNDGRYTGFNQGIYDTYSKGYDNIIDTVRQALPGIRITLLQPSPFDDVTRAPNFPGGYNAVLLRFGQYMQDLGKKDGLLVADLNAPVVSMLEKAKAADAATAQKIIPDRVHPGPGGHLIMAESILKAWNAPSLVSNVVIDAAKAKAVRAENTQVSQVAATAKSLSWTQQDNALPFPLPGMEAPVALALKSSDFFDALDQETLQVTGIKDTGSYSLRIDGHDVGDFTAKQLAAGINLATLSTPMSQQAAKVAQLVTQHNEQHFNRWRVLQVPLSGHDNPQVRQAIPLLIAGLDEEEAETVAQQWKAAVPNVHRYEIARALPGPTGPNLALHKPYVCSAPNQYNYGTGALTDGSWERNGDHIFATDDSGTFPKTVTVDLGEEQKLGVVVAGVPPFGSTKTIRVSVSADGKTFTDVGSYAFSLRYEEKHAFKFPAVSARYVRLTYVDHYTEEADFSPNFAFTSELEAYAPAH